MQEQNKYLQRAIQYLSALTNQRAVLYIAIGAVSICLILIVLGLMSPKGLPTDNQKVQDNQSQVVTTDSGITSIYTAQQAIDFVKDSFTSETVQPPDCSIEELRWTTFFSHRNYWKIAVLCPPDVANDIHVWTEYLYEFNEVNKSVKGPTPQ